MGKGDDCIFCQHHSSKATYAKGYERFCAKGHHLDRSTNKAPNCADYLFIQTGQTKKECD